MLLFENKITLEEIDLSAYEALDIMLRSAEETGFQPFGWKIFLFFLRRPLCHLFPIITMMQAVMTRTPENPTSPTIPLQIIQMIKQILVIF